MEKKSHLKREKIAMLLIRVYRYADNDPDPDRVYLVAEVDMTEKPRNEKRFAHEHGGDFIRVLTDDEISDLEME